MGAAIKTLRIPIGEVWSSPTYRARQTIRLAGLSAPRLAVELGDGGQSMQAATGNQANWLRGLVARPPRGHSDTLVVTHAPNINQAFGPQGTGLADGEALVFQLDGRADHIVARVKIADWPGLEGR
jgi:phosphohistidine phosphatase SixA